MTISYFTDLMRIIDQDVTTDKQNLLLIKKYLEDILNQKKRIYDTIQEKSIKYDTPITTSMQVLQQFAVQEIILQEYDEQRPIDLLQSYILEVGDQLAELDTPLAKVMKKLALLGSVGTIPLREFKFLQSHGYADSYRLLRASVHSIQKNFKLWALVELQDLYTELDEVAEDLRREQRKYELKIDKESKGFLIQGLRESHKNYTKDTILLVKGLLEIDDLLYPQLKGQLDDYYRTLTHENMVKLNRLVQIQNKVLLDEARLQQVVQSYRKKINKLIKKL